MAITTQRYQATLGASVTQVMLAGPNDVLTISKALVTNISTTTAYTFSVFDDNANAGASGANLCQNNISLSPKETKVLPLSALAVMAGGSLWAQASAGSVINLSITWSRTSQ